MFVYSVKSSSLKFASVILLAVIAFTALVIALPTNSTVTAASLFEGDGTVRYDDVKSNNDRIKFLSQFGWEISEASVDEAEIKIPADFDKIMNAYNELQKSQGMDLSAYKGKTVSRYTYEVNNYEGYDGTVYANIIIYDDTVIGGDICSSDVEGFIQGFEKVSHD